MAHLDARYCGQIFRRPRRLYDWRRPAAYRGGIRHHESPAWHNRRGELVWHPDRRHRPRRAIRLFRPQGHVHCRNDYFYDFPVLTGDELQLHLAGCFLVRPRRSARLRLSNRPFGHFRKHPKRHARETCARRLRLPGHWRADRDGHRLPGAQEHSRDRRLALDVCPRPSFPRCL